MGHRLISLTPRQLRTTKKPIHQHYCMSIGVALQLSCQSMCRWACPLEILQSTDSPVIQGYVPNLESSSCASPTAEATCEPTAEATFSLRGYCEGIKSFHYSIHNSAREERTSVTNSTRDGKGKRRSRGRSLYSICASLSLKGVMNYCKCQVLAVRVYSR